MRSGPLRHLFTVQQDSGSSLNAMNEVSASWTTYCQPYGSLTALAGREGEAIRQRYAEAEYQVMTRHSSLTSAITPAMRLVLGDRTFDILAAYDPTGRKADWLMVVKERSL